MAVDPSGTSGASTAQAASPASSRAMSADAGAPSSTVAALRAMPHPARASMDAVLGVAWDAPGPFTAADALAAAGLTRSTTIEAIDDLVRLGLLRELPNARGDAAYSRGRPARRFELADDAAVVIGLDAGRTHITTTVADLRGRPLAARVVEAPFALGAPRGAGGTDLAEDGAAVSRLLAAEGVARRPLIDEEIRRTLRTAGRAPGEVLAICAGVPAPVDRSGASPAHRHGFWQAMNPDLVGLLGQLAPLAVVRNDSSLAAVAEGAPGGAAEGLDSYVALMAGDRFGMGVVLNGHLLAGAHGGTGETKGFRMVSGVGSDEGLGVRIARWGRDALAGVSASGRAGTAPPGIEEPLPPVPLPDDHPLRGVAPGQVSAREVLALARRGDAAGLEIEHRAGELLARVAAVLGSLYDPERIVVSGAIAASLDGVIAVAQDLVADQLDLPAPEIVASTLGGDVVSQGAVRAAVEAARRGALHLAG